MSAFAYSRGRAKTDAFPEQRHASGFDQFREAVLADRSPRKGLAFFCAPFRKNGDGRAHRDRDHVLPCAFLACDFDDLTPSKATFVRKALKQWKAFAYTTPSSTRERPRMRAVIALDRPVKRDEQLRIGSQLQSLFGGEGIALDPNQFRPEQCADVPIVGATSWRFDGKPLGVDVFLSAPPVEGSSALESGQRIRKGKRHEFLLSLLPQLRRLPPHLRRAAVHGFNVELCEEPLDRQEVDDLADWSADGSAPWPSHLDLLKLDKLEPTKPQFIAPGILAGYACGLYGHGGIGKSFLALLLAVCIALGMPFCGVAVERRRVAWFGEEDRESVIHARLVHICRFLKVSLAALDGWLFVYDLVGHDTVLYAPNTRGADPRTLVFESTADCVRKHDLEVLFFDGLAGFFAGNENVRTDSKGFVSLLLNLIGSSGAVVVIGHIDKLSARNDARRDAYSGSTGWWNAFRTMLLLYPETTGGERTGKLILELQKSNHGTVGTQFEFRWDDAAHMFVGAAILPATAAERAQLDHIERMAVLNVLRLCEAAKMSVPSATTGPRTAYHVLSVHPEFPEALRLGRAGIRRFWRHIEALRVAGEVAEGVVTKPNRQKLATLVSRSGLAPPPSKKY